MTKTVYKVEEFYNIVKVQVNDPMGLFSSNSYKNTMKETQ